MRKIAGILAALFLLFAVFAAGRVSGIRHAINDAEMWRDGDGIFIQLDGELYMHGGER